jgi:two-component system chemotaxis response regulator CheB
MAENKINTDQKLLVIGGSAGSLLVLLEVLPRVIVVPSLSIVIVVHRKNTPDLLLSDLLASRSGLVVKEIEDKEKLKGGEVYIAPADYHILFENDGTISLDFSEKVNFSRPSIDVAFESAAGVFNDKLTCLLLSGASADGVKGMIEAQARYGKIAVQDPETAQSAYMPEQAVRRVSSCTILKPADMAHFINAL